jgi:hydrogenase maturation protein HypF
LADEMALDGWVVNDTRGVTIEVDGESAPLERFLERLAAEKPTSAVIESVTTEWSSPVGYLGFAIRDSDEAGERTVQVLPDIATCPACRDEVLDPADRRHDYPFTNCTHCGPRFSIIRSLPYDRRRTTMERFTMCSVCRAEYENHRDRRFHAQPNACPTCGPRLALWNADGSETARGDDALREAVEAISRGDTVAVKGLGGFHLLVDARNGEAVERLREKKPRREKPFAVMVRDLESAKELCHIDGEEAAALSSPEAPILLLRRRKRIAVHPAVAPANPYLGLMLPYTPLHHLILRAAGFPVVATSGNLSEEPICTSEYDAVRALAGVADLFLVHDRPIARHVDDSVAWRIDGRTRLLRRARGFAPRPVLLDDDRPIILAVGAHLKNAVALSVGRRVFVSQHIGDMETPEALGAFERVIADFLELYGARPVAVAHDLHPDHVTTGWARQAVGLESGGARSAVPELEELPLIPVQHHHAHLASCLAENAVEGLALGVTWDGTGYGTDHTVWGGEFLEGSASGFERVAHLQPFPLPGGESAVREPRRSALGILWETVGKDALDRDELDAVRSFEVEKRRLLARMLERGLNCPVTTSAGRVFDAVAALLGLRLTTSFEGQAAMELEFVADPTVRDYYPFKIRTETSPDENGRSVLVVDWRLMVEAILHDSLGTLESVIAARFHNTLAEVIVRVAREVGRETVALSGGCFQNRLLTERALEGLRGAGHRVLLHRQVPPGDGGISLGQIAVAARRLQEPRDTLKMR